MFRPKVRVHHTYTEENRFSGEGYVGQHEQDGRRDPHCVSWDVVSNVPQARLNSCKWMELA